MEQVFENSENGSRQILGKNKILNNCHTGSEFTIF